MSKKSLKDVMNALENYPKPNFKSMTNKELFEFRYVELNTEDYKRLTDELRKRKLI